MNVATLRADQTGWTQLVEEAVHEPNASLSNLKVTLAHYGLSLALQEVIGPEAGTNFHTWAVWGSRKAGVTIREEGLDRALREVTLLALCAGLLTGFLLGVGLTLWLPWWVVLIASLLGAVVGAWTGRAWLTLGRRQAARLMLAGNRTVLEDIGGQTARYLAWFRQADRGDPDAFASFLEGFLPGPTEKGGQDLLRDAFVHYHRAACTEDVQAKQQWTYSANCLAILHEHLRLQPYIVGALPWIVRRCVTARLMRYDVGPLRLAVGDEVPSLEGVEFSDSGPVLTVPDALVQRFDLAARGHTRAHDWTDLSQRMGYILALFRTLHLHPDVFTPPYTPRQFEQIEAHGIPSGLL